MFLHVRITYTDIPPSNRLRLIPDTRYYIIRDTGGAIDIRLRKRTAYPVTYCLEQPDGTFLFGYGSQHVTANDSPEEHLRITVSTRGELTLQRDAFVTLPIFFARMGDTLIIDNLYENVLGFLPKATVTTSHLLDALAQCSIHLNDTPVKEIALINERETCYSNADGTTIRFPASREWGISREAPPTAAGAYPETLTEYLEYFAQSRLSGTNFAYHASGGLDSATLPFFLGKKYGVRAPLATVWYPAGQKVTQQPKIQQLMSRAGSVHIATEIDGATDFPLAHQILTGNFSPLYLNDEIYVGPNERLADQLQAMGVTVLCTGMGGDDILENIVSLEHRHAYGSIEKEQRKTQNLPPYFNDSFRHDYIAATPMEYSRPLPLLPLSSLTPAGNNIYIERDIWPVSPFRQPALFDFCQGLGPQFRSNKNILRMYHHAHGFPEEIYNAKTNEDFGKFFTDTMMNETMARALRHMAAASITRKMGYVATDRLLRTHASFPNASQPSDWLFLIYRWLIVETHLQYMPQPYTFG